MKSQRIPEHKLNLTNTMDQAIENIEKNYAIATDKTKTTENSKVDSKELR
jgi:hypothetical protein